MVTSDHKKINRFTLIFFIVAVSLFLITCIGTCVSSNDKSDGIDSIHIQLLAKSKAEYAVKSILKSPSSANFDSNDQKLWMLPDSSIVIKGSVDADNEYGANIRSRYYVKLKWSIDQNKQEVLKLIDINIK